MTVYARSGVVLTVGSCVRTRLCVGVPAFGIGELVVIGIFVGFLFACPDNIVTAGALRPVAGRAKGRDETLPFPADGTSKLPSLVGWVEKTTIVVGAWSPVGLVERGRHRSGSGRNGRHDLVVSI